MVLPDGTPAEYYKEVPHLSTKSLRTGCEALLRRPFYEAFDCSPNLVLGNGISCWPHVMVLLHSTKLKGALLVEMPSGVNGASVEGLSTTMRYRLVVPPDSTAGVRPYQLSKEAGLFRRLIVPLHGTLGVQLIEILTYCWNRLRPF